MKLYIKGERRYREASISEILETASDCLSDLGIGPKYAAVLLGMAVFAAAQEASSLDREIKKIERSKRVMLPGEEEVKPPRRGAEPV